MSICVLELYRGIKMSNMFDIEPCDFPLCPSCNSSEDVDIDEIESSNLKRIFCCRKCGIAWEESK